jgi:hypothetical protein
VFASVEGDPTLDRQRAFECFAKRKVPEVSLRSGKRRTILEQFLLLLLPPLRPYISYLCVYQVSN